MAKIDKWDQQSRLPVAVCVDVDGTLAGLYQSGRRELRSSAVVALELLSRHAPVFLWSIAGAENGDRLIEEFPQLRPFVTGCYSKEGFPLHLVDNAFAIDDGEIDQAVLECNHVVLDETYYGGEDSGSLLEAAKAVLAAMQARG